MDLSPSNVLSVQDLLKTFLACFRQLFQQHLQFTSLNVEVLFEVWVGTSDIHGGDGDDNGDNHDDDIDADCDMYFL